MCVALESAAEWCPQSRATHITIMCGRTSELAYADPTMHVSARALPTAADQQMRVYVRVRLLVHQQ